MTIPAPIQKFIDQQAADAPADYSDLKAVFLSGTLKRSPESSHTDGLIDLSADLLRKVGVSVDVVRAVDFTFPPGVETDMREHGWSGDEFTDLYHRLVEPADIVVIATPTWLGDQSSQTRLLIERLYGWSSETSASGQYSNYGKVGGVIVTGNEDGAKHCAAQIIYALQHMGLVIPPQADCYWNGEAGPGPSYLDEGSGGPENAWTTRNAVFMTWNLLHLARLLKDAGGVPAIGNLPQDWNLDTPKHPNPEYL